MASLRLPLAALALASCCGLPLADPRPLPAALNAGFHLSPLRQHPVTGEDFRPTSTREFLDIMLHSTPFSEGIEQGTVGDPGSYVPYNMPPGIEVTFTEDGYPRNLTNFTQWGDPRQMSVKTTIGKGGAFVEDGEYMVTWQGTGSLSFEGDAEFVSAPDAHSAIVVVRPAVGVVIRIYGTDVDDPLHGLSMVHTKYADLNPRPIFHPDFLDKLRGASVLRFAGWQLVDAWGHEASLVRKWEDRPLPSHQTQAGKWGVSVEYMVALANEVGAHPWFSMPKAAEVGADVIDPYAAAFAELVQGSLRPDLKVYVEYRSCCLNGLAPGWDSQENAVQSLTLWSSWESKMNASRVVNLISSLQQVDKFGTDIGRVEAAAIETAFGEICNYGEEPCTSYSAIEAPDAYGDSTPDSLVDEILWPAMLKTESLVNTRVQQALHYNMEVVAFNALPMVSARSYGHRGTLNWALQCEACLMRQVGHRYGVDERAALAREGYVFEAGFRKYFEYEGLRAEDRVTVDGSYWHLGSPEAAKGLCAQVPDCVGFTYVKSGEWSCGVGNEYRYGNCDTPGTAYFFNGVRAAEGSRRPPTSCESFIVPGTEDCTAATADTYFKVDTRSYDEQLAAEEAAVAACETCKHTFDQHWYTADIPEEGYSLDRLHRDLPVLVEKAAEEQRLELKMMEALRTDAVEGLMLHFMEHLRGLGFSTVVGGTMHRTQRLCREGGKACGIQSMMTHPDDDGPVRRAVASYNRGVRGPELPNTDTAWKGSCAQPCVYGVCELGACRCWERAGGADCSVLDTSPRCERPLGLSLSGISYWMREWTFVDAFKSVGDWLVQEFTSYSWNTGTEVTYRDDGYPAYLGVNQKVQLLTLRSIERHYTDGWYTVLYDGQGILDFNMDITCVHRLRPGHIKVHLTLRTGPNDGFGIAITHTLPSDPIRNIRIITPGFEEVYATSPFHPAFKASLKRFSLLRYMDWMHANVEGIPWNWESRVTPNFYTQGKHDKGVSFEYMILLANEMAKDPWFSLPVNATDDYMRRFAELVARDLRPDVTVYVELANEVWHYDFFGGQYAQQQAAAAGISWLCWYAKRTGEMSRIVKEVLAKTHQVIVVAGSQHVNEDVTRQLLACEGIGDADAFGLGSYFNGYNALPNPDADLTAVLDSYEVQVALTVAQVHDHKALLKGTHYKLVTYESGPAGEGDGTGTDLAIQAHRHPRMREIVYHYLEAMSQLFDLLVYFASCGVPSKYGSWGLIEAMDQPRSEAPKYLAVQDFLNNGTTCPQTTPCAGAAGCNGLGVCGTDDECYCYRGYSGPTCLDASFTDYIACGYRCTFDQGECRVAEVFGTVRAWNCSCGEQYSGATCGRWDCKDGCNQRGHCIASGVCSCFRGFKGEACEVDCGCDHHGQCNANNECICDRGWRRKASGRGCEWDCDTADSVGCSGPGRSACPACEMGTCVDGACRCWAGYHGAACDVLDETLKGNHQSTFGINVALTHATFVDVMKTSREWTSIWNHDTFAGQFSYQGGSLLWENRQYEWGNGQQILQGDDGYILQLAPDQAVITLSLRDVCLHAPEGRFVVTYDGDGELDFGMDSTPAAFQKGRIDIDFAPTCRRECWFDKKTWEPYCTDNGIAATIKAVNPANPIRNIKIIMPSFFATHDVEPFHPWFLKNLERFSFIRFMDWGKTNEDGFVKRTPVSAKFIRFTSLSTKGGGAPRLADLMLRGPRGETLSCTSAVEDVCDQDPYTDWAPEFQQGGSHSVVVELPEGSKVSSYMWITSGWNSRVDPVTWLLEVSLDGTTWQVLDRRSTTQKVTFYRRRFAASESKEEQSWYPIRTAEDLWEWADRTLPSHRTQTHGPVALEYQVLLANTLGASPWVCVHHLASDDYVRQEAAFWLAHLRPDVSVYVEHSNEVWNPLFPQGRHATEQGTALGLVDGTCKSNPEHCARVRYNAKRSEQIFTIWAQVWGSSRSRLKFVLSTQGAWMSATEDLLSLGTVGADLLGITGYMGPAGSIDHTYSSKTTDEVGRLFREGAEAERSKMQALKAKATEHGLGLAVYEGGVGLVESGVIESGEATGYVTELLIATGRSPSFQADVKVWLDMLREELGDETPFGYFVDTGFWSKYGQWGMREYYDAATWSSPAAAAVHQHLDEVQGARPSCVAERSLGRGLAPDAFFGHPAVLEPTAGAELVAGKRYKLRWAAPERLPADLRLDLYLWRATSCSGTAVPLGWANARGGEASWKVPEDAVGESYFVELRPQAPHTQPSNYSSFFTVLSPEQAPLDYVLYVENDVDLLSAFHRDCKQGKEWALHPSFKISSCVYSSAEGCRTYRTARRSPTLDGPPPWLHGSFKPLTDCTLHIIGVRQTMRLEGLTRGFELGAEDNLARVVANVSQLPPGAVSIKLVGTAGGRRLSATAVDLEIEVASDDHGLASAALGLATLSENTAFVRTAGSVLGEERLAIISGNITAEERADDTAAVGGRCMQLSAATVQRIRQAGYMPSATDCKRRRL